MAQLLKLEDYVSRYQEDLFFYINRFKKLKQRRWIHLKKEWEWLHSRSQDKHDNVTTDDEFLVYLENEKENPLTKVTTMEEFVDYYKSYIYRSQLNWASSTMYERSTVSSYYRSNNLLKGLLTNLPDTYLIFYEPVIHVKRATSQLEIIIVTPLDIKVIKHLEGEKGSVFNGVSKYAWQEVMSHRTQRRVNPILSLNRTETYIRGLMKRKQIDLPIESIIYVPESYVEFVDTPPHVKVIDKRVSYAWYEKLNSQISPYKHTQFQAAKALLNQSLTSV